MIRDHVVHALPVTRIKNMHRAQRVAQRARHRCVPANLAGLDASLVPPSWLRNAIAAVAKNIDARISIPTPGGPLVLDPKDPATRQRILDAIKGTRVSVTGRAGAPAPASNPLEQVDQHVQENVPGGWLTVIAVGLVGAALLGSSLSSRHR